MSYKSILTYLDGGARHGAVIDAGLCVADAFDAHITALNVYLPSYQAYAYYGEYPVWEDDTLEREDEEARETAERLQREFQAHARCFGSDKCEWRFMQGDITQGVSLHARYADLVVMAQKDPDDEMSRGSADLPAQVALAAARPVLVVPRTGAVDSLGQNVMLAWNASREATRAATAALAFLKRSAHVTVVVIDEGKRLPTAHGEEPGADIALYLARHGINAEVAQVAKGSSEVSDVLLAAVAERATDLLCMGAYGHSRWREWMLGGTTRDVLRRATVPILFAC